MYAESGSYNVEAKPSDFNRMPFGIWVSQVCMGLPKMRKLTPRGGRWAAMESPYGPAPTIATSTIGPMPRFLSLRSCQVLIPQEKDFAKFVRIE